jgi:membrane protease YdiL (CAAX protease family)
VNETLLDPLTRPQPLASTLNPPWGWAEIIKAVLFVLLGMLGLSVLIAGVRLATGFEVNPAQGMSSPLLFVLGVGVYGLVILGVYLFAVRRPGSSWAALGIREFAWWWGPAAVGLLFVGFSGMVLINLVLVPLISGGPFENPQIEAITGGSRLSFGNLVLLLLLIAVVAPVAEELFFRGMLYPVMRRHWGPAWAIILNALVFALVHFIPILIPGLFFVGLILAWMREQSGSVLPGILLHALQNGVALLAIFALTRM